MISLNEDRDIKIAGNRPSFDIKNNASPLSTSEEFNRERENGNTDRAKRLGRLVAEEICRSGDVLVGEADRNAELKSHRGVLITFAAVSGLELACPSAVTVYAAQNSFYNTLKDLAPVLYKNASDTGEFSFYYLAFRRGGDIERRIGQTFAMLCSHDGDPVYQELGEALYCWFSSVVKKKAEEVGL